MKDICAAAIPQLNQVLANNQAAVTQLESTGQDVTELQETIDDVAGIVGLVDDGCEYLTGIFDEVVKLFLPGACCVVSILFALYMNLMLCCSTGCCKAPPSDGKIGVTA